MKTIQIQAKPFFEMLKSRDVSMWAMFVEMLSPDYEQLVIFLDESGKEVAHYIIPTSPEQLAADQKAFAQEYKDKLRSALN